MTAAVTDGHPVLLPPAIFLMGPTASGKTGLAIKLRQRFPLEIISVDSALVYRGMEIGTAKPDATILAHSPHRLIDIRDPAESYSAAEFRADALAEMDAITRSGRVPLLVGGTMLYFRALCRGLATMPAASAPLRQRLDEEGERLGWPAMHARLATLDPRAAARINANDPQRIQRALEVLEITGRTLSELHAEQQHTGESDFNYRVLRIVVCPSERHILHKRINTRFLTMLEQGFLHEMKALHDRGDLDPGMPSMRCVGYRQAWEYLEGRLTREEFVNKAMAATRQLAKRQLTWLRQEPAALWYDLDEDSAQESVFKSVAGFVEM